MTKRKMLSLTTTLGVASVLALIVGLASNKGILPKAHAGEESLGEKGCSEATLEGDYLFTGLAFSPSGVLDPTRPALVAGVRTFDGAGNLSQIQTASQGGVITSDVQAMGTYTLDSDCTGRMTIAGTAHWDIFVARDGSEGAGVSTNEGRINQQTFRKSAPAKH